MNLHEFFFICWFTVATADEKFLDYIVKNNAANYSEAKAGCSSINASLVAIKNQAQNQLVLQQIKRYVDNEHSSSTLDLFFVLDGSGSLSESNFNQVKQWVMLVSRHFNLENNSTQIGVVQYSSYNHKRSIFNQTTLKVYIRLGEAKSQTSFDNKVNMISHLGGKTVTGKALNLTAFELMNSTRFMNSNNSQVIVLVTDGRTTSYDKRLMAATAHHLRSNKIVLITVEVTRKGLNLKALESKIGLDSSVYRVRKYRNLFKIEKRVVHAVKQVSIKSPLFWIGLQRNQRNANSRNFSWLDGDQPNFTKWIKNEKTEDSNKNCVAIYNRCCPSNYRWVKVECNGSFSGEIKPEPFICEKEKEEVFCPNTKVLIHNTSFTFEKTKLNDVASSTEVCQVSGQPLATARCVRGFFDLSTLKTISCEVKSNSPEQQTPEELTQLSVLTSNPEKLTNKEREKVVQYLWNYLNQTNTTITKKVLKASVLTVGNLLKVRSSNTTYHSKKSYKENLKVLDLLNNFSSHFVLPKNLSSFKIQTPNIDLQFKRVTENQSNPFIPFDLKNDDAQASVHVDIDSASPRGNNQSGGIVFASLVSAQVLEEKSENLSQVINIGTDGNDNSGINGTLSFSSEERFSNLEVFKENPVKSIQTEAELLKRKGYDWVICQDCNEHNATPPAYQIGEIGSYTLLFSTRIIPSIVILTIVSYVGIGISSMFLIATVFIYLRYKKLRHNPTSTALVNISIMMLVAYLMFAVGIGRVSNAMTCNIFTFLLQFSLLSCFAWMTLNAIQMQRAFTTMEFVGTVNKVASYLLTYGLCFVFTMTNFSVTVLYLDPQRRKSNEIADVFFESYYRASFMCWLISPSLDWGFLLPLGIMLFINTCIFFSLLKKVIFKSKKKIRSTAQEKSFQERLVNAFTLFLMMGLTWIFGYFLLVPEDVGYQEAFKWLFTIFNVFQGVVIFILYCCRREEIRKRWLTDIFNCSPESKTKRKSFTSTSESERTSANNRFRDTSVRLNSNTEVVLSPTTPAYDGNHL